MWGAIWGTSQIYTLDEIMTLSWAWEPSPCVPLAADVGSGFVLASHSDERGVSPSLVPTRKKHEEGYALAE